MSTNRKPKVNVMTLKDPSEFDKLDAVIRQGPATLILIHSPSCGHCHSYMPTWNRLQKTPNKQTNMVTMEASVFDQTPLSEKKSINSVPSVLYVNPAGDISEVSDIRNASNMKQIVTSGSPGGGATPGSSSMSNLNLSALLESTEPSSVTPAVLPPPPALPTSIAAMTEPNPLRPSPAAPAAPLQNQNQRGGNPLIAAAPVALLGGLYALPMRSSGLLAPRHSAKWQRMKRRILSRKRRATRRRGHARHRKAT